MFILMELYSVLLLNYNDRFSISINDIKKQYRRLAKLYHPDKYKGSDANEKFNQIHIAYEFLSNPKQKKEYDECSHSHEEVDWWEILCKKYSWLKILFTSQDDLKQLFEKKQWNELKASENLVRTLGEKINLKIDWKKDIILQVKVNNKETSKISYTRRIHKITGIIITFELQSVEFPFELDETYNYTEELITYENLGNETVEDNKIIIGDLHLDII